MINKMPLRKWDLGDFSTWHVGNCAMSCAHGSFPIMTLHTISSI